MEVDMKIAGYVLSIGGVIALIYSGINYLNESESFSMMGVDFAVSKGDPMPIVISVIVLVAGIMIVKASNKN
mgnify:CR=1 FL=1